MSYLCKLKIIQQILSYIFLFYDVDTLYSALRNLAKDMKNILPNVKPIIKEITIAIGRAWYKIYLL